MSVQEKSTIYNRAVKKIESYVLHEKMGIKVADELQLSLKEDVA